MSNNINFSGSIQRALKGDIDPINLFGINPSRAEQRANVADRQRRSSQIASEQGSEALKAAGGSIDPATKQVKKLKSKTQFASLSPFAPPGGFARTVNLLTEVAKKDKDKSAAARRLAKKNKAHEASALTARNLITDKAPDSAGTTRFSDTRLRRSILGGVRS